MNLLTKLRTHPFLALEFIVLCVVLPTIIIKYHLAKFMFLFLWGAAAYCWFIFRTMEHHRETLKQLWKWDAINKQNLRIIIPRWIIACIGMTIFIWLYNPDQMFAFAGRLPIFVIPFLLCAYTILSALPQEFIFCTYFFDRYAPFFTSIRAKILASAIVFAYAHVLFINPVAPPLSFIAGLIFASTYWRTKSLALVTFEHGLYGGWLFIVGLGFYFYHGNVP
jgi:uncharacterized protein